jgi:DNA-directed RNA polymerase specialized sigma24 family protein
MDLQDGDLVRLARDGDPAAFRLLVERHLPMARARAARLCPQPDDADDAVQDAFLQVFLSLDRLRDPDRFAGWLGGIVANLCRAQRRRAPLTLLGDWPGHQHHPGRLPERPRPDRAPRPAPRPAPRKPVTSRTRPSGGTGRHATGPGPWRPG